MIDNVDRMSVNIFHLFRSSYSHSFEGTCQLEEAGFENPELRLQPDQTVLKLRISRSWKESRQESRAETISFEDEDPKPVPNHLLKKDQFVDDLFIIYRINQEPGSVCVRVRWDEPTRIFSRCFMSDKGNEVSLISYRTSDVIGIRLD